MKKCFKCGAKKDLSEFYAHKGMADGRLNKCKECTKKDTKENRSLNIDYYLEYDRSRSSLPHRVSAKKKYLETERGRSMANKASAKWRELNLIKRAAQIIIGNAVRDGRIKRPDLCSECGAKGRVQGHHDDYSMPMSVRWLCAKCHSAWHKSNTPING